MAGGIKRMRQRIWYKCPAIALVALLLLPVVNQIAAEETIRFQGFGASAGGENNRPVVTVTSLDDSGPGTLRSALERGNRHVVFKVGGTIALKSKIVLRQSEVTIDGRNAPSPGITITGRSFILQDVQNVVVRNLRFRESDDDNIRITGGSRNIVIDHCSSTRAMDGALDITLDYKTDARPRDITVSWCLFAGTDKASLIQSVSNLSMHHNLFINNGQRNPQLHDVRDFDLRNNVISYWLSYGTRIRAGSTGNLVNNLFGASMNPQKRVDAALLHDYPDDAVPEPPVFMRGNVGPAPFDPNRLATTQSELQAPPVDTTAAALLMTTLVKNVGAQPIDRIDREYLEINRELGFRSAPK